MFPFGTPPAVRELADALAAITHPPADESVRDAFRYATRQELDFPPGVTARRDRVAYAVRAATRLGKLPDLIAELYARHPRVVRPFVRQSIAGRLRRRRRLVGFVGAVAGTAAVAVIAYGWPRYTDVVRKLDHAGAEMARKDLELEGGRARLSAREFIDGFRPAVPIKLDGDFWGTFFSSVRDHRNGESSDINLATNILDSTPAECVMPPIAVKLYILDNQSWRAQPVIKRAGQTDYDYTAFKLADWRW